MTVRMGSSKNKLLFLRRNVAKKKNQGMEQRERVREIIFNRLHAESRA